MEVLISSSEIGVIVAPPPPPRTALSADPSFVGSAGFANLG